MEQLNVNPADLLRTAGAYAELGGRVAEISPQAAAEVQRVADTHGPMGYPAVVGIAAAMTNAEAPLIAKAVDFQMYSQRFTEHAANYVTQDREGAQRLGAIDWHLDTPRRPGDGTGVVDHSLFTPVSNMIQPPRGGYVTIWCTPLTLGFSCEYLWPGGGYSRYWSQWDLTGGQPI